jgi:hypothetical protein
VAWTKCPKTPHISSLAPGAGALTSRMKAVAKAMLKKMVVMFLSMVAARFLP